MVGAIVEQVEAITPGELPTFAERLLSWYAHEGRHDLPWQQNRTVYRVWVSEVMLQQTQVSTVREYFERFMQRFPDVRALADAAEDDVLHLWSGLGYYARARNLHRAAKVVVDRFDGRFPRDVAELESLPGIGRSTAGAILAQALDERHPILDGNVKRVLSRWAGVEGFPGLPAVATRLWDIADQLTPAHRARDYTQAIMDLGATCCTRGRPGCERCPIREDCLARQTNRVGDLPTARGKKARPVRKAYWLILFDPARRRVVMQRRPSAGLWGGLYGFMECVDEKAVGDAYGMHAVCSGTALKSLPVIRHAFSHFELDIHAWVGTVVGDVVVPGGTWYNLTEPSPLGLAAPVAALLRRLEGEW